MAAKAASTRWPKTAMPPMRSLKAPVRLGLGLFFAPHDVGPGNVWLIELSGLAR